MIRKKLPIKTLMLLWFFSLFLGFVGASTLKIQTPPVIYQWCVQPYVVKMDTNWTDTKSIDTKIFLSTYFSIYSPYVQISTAISEGNLYANYIPWIFDTTNIQDGIANSWYRAGSTYLYINSFQLGWFWSPINGENKDVATLYLKAKSFDTWHLEFYYITGWNWDDSNISSWINEWIITWAYTLYEDFLSNVINIEKSLSPLSLCDSKPYIDTATYWQTGYISTSTWIKAVWTSVVAWPIYSWTPNRTVWTKENVKLFLTWVSDSYSGSGWLIQDWLSNGIQLNTVSVISHTYLSPINFSIPHTGWQNQYYELSINGNMSTDFNWFDNILWNTWDSYKTGWNNYENKFNIDVFWIDTVWPINDWYLTGYISNTGVWYTNYILSGSNFDWSPSNAINWFHASWTDMDDQYKVIWFSGYNTVTQNCLDLWYECTQTWYMNYLNTIWYVLSGNNIFKLNHEIVFTNSFSGYIIVVDRAGNTWHFYIQIAMDDSLEVDYGIIAYTESVWSRVTNNLSGMLLKLAIYSGGFDKQRLLGNPWAGIELIYTGWVKTSATWWAEFTGNFPSWEYRVLAEWVHTLSYLVSGVSLSPVWWLIDFSIDYPNGFKFWDLNNILTQWSIKHANYIQSTIREQIVNVADLATLITIWAPWNPANYQSATPELWIYTGWLFVDIPNGNRIDTYNNLLLAPTPEKYMQYHPYDIDSNGQVNVNDYSSLFGNLWLTGVTYGGRLSWPSSSNATMPF